MKSKCINLARRHMPRQCCTKGCAVYAWPCCLAWCFPFRPDIVANTGHKWSCVGACTYCILLATHYTFPRLILTPFLFCRSQSTFAFRDFAMTEMLYTPRTRAFALNHSCCWSILHQKQTTMAAHPSLLGLRLLFLSGSLPLPLGSEMSSRRAWCSRTCVWSSSICVVSAATLAWFSVVSWRKASWASSFFFNLRTALNKAMNMSLSLHLVPLQFPKQACIYTIHRAENAHAACYHRYLKRFIGCESARKDQKKTKTECWKRTLRSIALGRQGCPSCTRDLAWGIVQQKYQVP